MALTALRAPSRRTRNGVRNSASSPSPACRGSATSTFSQHRHAAEQAQILERAGDPGAHQFMRPQTTELLAFVADLTGVGAQEAGEQVERRCFAGPVRADQAGDPTACEARCRGC